MSISRSVERIAGLVPVLLGVSVIVFLCVFLIAFIFIRGFGTSLAQQRGE